MSNLDGRVYVYACIWLGLGLVSGLGLVLWFGLGLGFAMICSGHGHLCLTGCGNSAPYRVGQKARPQTLHLDHTSVKSLPI